MPEGATITYQGSLGVSMYSIDSADIGHSMMITKIPSAPGIDSTSLLKVMSDTFVQQMKAQESIVNRELIRLMMIRHELCNCFQLSNSLWNNFHQFSHPQE